MEEVGRIIQVLYINNTLKLGGEGWRERLRDRRRGEGRLAAWLALFGLVSVRGASDLVCEVDLLHRRGDLRLCCFLSSGGKVHVKVPLPVK
jgi:hypothetical protein